MTPRVEGAPERKELPITLTAVPGDGTSHCSPVENQTQNQDLLKTRGMITALIANTALPLGTRPCSKPLIPITSFNPHSNPKR